ncbi:MAG: lysophospholipid acyltransferase family protein [Chitinophagaceae bacterium]
MRMLKNVFARIWALWGMISFIATFLIFFIPSMLTWLLPDPLGQRIFCGISRIWMRIWLTLVGCPFRIKGREHFEKGKSYVVACNHNSLMDVPLSSPFIPGANKTIAKSSFTKVPLFGFYYMKGAVLVNRKDEMSRKVSFDKMKAVLKKGMHMCVYPEGTRNRTNEPLKSFYDGAFKLAMAGDVAIIPAIIFNTKKALPLTKAFYFMPTRLEMHFLEPITTGTQTKEELKEKVFNVMKDYYVQHSRQ